MLMSIQRRIIGPPDRIRKWKIVIRFSIQTQLLHFINELLNLLKVRVIGDFGLLSFENFLKFFSNQIHSANLEEWLSQLYFAAYTKLQN
jgi:hypothetical protein